MKDLEKFGAAPAPAATREVRRQRRAGGNADQAFAVTTVWRWDHDPAPRPSRPLAGTLVLTAKSLVKLIIATGLVTWGVLLVVHTWNDGQLSDAALVQKAHGMPLSVERSGNLLAFGFGAMLVIGGLGMIEEIWLSLRRGVSRDGR